MRQLIALFFILLTLSISAAPPRSMQEAIAIIDVSPIDNIEGIWHHPADDATLLILRNNLTADRYDIILLESPDCRFTPGDRLGYVTPQVTPGSFTITLLSKWEKGTLIDPVNINATLHDASGTILFNNEKLKITLSPSVSLPRLFGFLRLGVRIKLPSDPAPKDGWRKMYPLPTSPSSPIYL